MESMLILWIVLAGVFFVVELATVAFVAMYLALGSIAAAIVASLGGGLLWQVVAAIATGVLLMAVTRPLLKNRLEPADIATNVNLLIGKGGIVTIAIDNDENTGQIRVGSEYWTARLPEGRIEVIPVDARVGVVSVEGVTARVEPR